MKFYVDFKSDCGYPIDVASRGNAGLKYLDKARMCTGVKKLAAEIVSSYIPHLYENLRVEISEEVARKSGRFAEYCCIAVKCPSKSLNALVSAEPDASVDEKTGRITSVAWVNRVEDSDLVTAWSEAGYPLEWTPSWIEQDDEK